MFGYNYYKLAKEAKINKLALTKTYRDTKKTAYLVYSGRGRFSYASFDTMNHNTINYKNWRDIHENIKRFW